MLSIEFIGASCIGKTHFLKEFYGACGPGNKWDTHLNDLRKINSVDPAFYKLVQQIIRRITGKSFSKNKRKSALFEAYSDDIEPIIDVFINSQHIGQDLAWQKIRLFDYFVNSILYQCLWIQDKIADDIIVLFDEGIVHNGGLFSILDNPDRFSGILTSSIFPKAVVHFEIDNKLYRKRIYERFQKFGERKINSLNRNISDDSIDDFMNRSKAHAEKSLLACKILNIPVLELNAESSEENFKKLKHLIMQISEKG